MQKLVVGPNPPDFYPLAKKISRFFPQFRQSLVPAAIVAVELVTNGIFFVIVLVIIFCGIESRGSDDFSNNVTR